MKKIQMAFLVTVLLSNISTFAIAAQPGTSEYEKLKEYKKTQREKRNNPAAAGEKGFWQKEAERSGFAGTAAMFGNAVTGVIPLDKPNSRK
jgi:hypothetical protein